MSDKPELKVVDLDAPWAGRIEPKTVIQGVLEDDTVEDVLILTYNNGGVLKAHSSIGDVSEALLIIERFKYALISGQFETF